MVSAFLWGASALAVGGIATLATCLAGVLLGLFQRAFALLGIRTHFEEPLIRVWAGIIHHLCLKQILGVTVNMQGDIRPLGEDEIGLCIGNHPSTIAAGSFAWVVTQFVSARVVAIAKQEHLNTPLGWCLKALDFAIFVDRSDPAQSLAAVGERLSREIETPCALILLPDTGWASAQRIAQDIKRFRGRIPGIEQWLTQTRAPRCGGLSAALQVLGARAVRIFNVTIALCPRDWSIADVLRRQRHVLKIVVEEVELPTGREWLEQWLNAEWQRKNAIISRWRTESST